MAPTSWPSVQHVTPPTWLFLSVFLVLLFTSSLTSSLVCVPCDPDSCEEITCQGSKVPDPCGCCLWCARQRGESCGGPWDLEGTCDHGLWCVSRVPFWPGYDYVGVCEPEQETTTTATTTVSTTTTPSDEFGCIPFRPWPCETTIRMVLEIAGRNRTKEVIVEVVKTLLCRNAPRYCNGICERITSGLKFTNCSGSEVQFFGDGATPRSVCSRMTFCMLKD